MNEVPQSKEIERFLSWYDAAKKIGLIYMLLERFFYALSFMSILNFRYYVSRKAYGKPKGKTYAIAKDVCKIAFYFVFGVFLPAWLYDKQICQLENSALLLGSIGIFLIAIVVQHNVNLTIFDSFRARRLPIPKQGNGIWLRIEAALNKILPTDLSAKVIQGKGYSLTSGQRRVVLSVLDFWLMLVGFALIYFTFLPDDFSEPFAEFSNAVYFTVVTGTTLGFGDITPKFPLSKSICIFETFTCFIFALIIISNAVSFLPKPDKEEE